MAPIRLNLSLTIFSPSFNLSVLYFLLSIFRQVFSFSALQISPSF
jgi:hypothetical protein